MNSSYKKSRSQSGDHLSVWGKFKRTFNSAPKTTEDMVAIVDAATENEVIDDDAKRIIEGALEVSEKHARDIMVPRTQMVVLKVDDSFFDNINKIVDTGHSRYPVIRENIDEVLGILLTKDLLGIIAEFNHNREDDAPPNDHQDEIKNLLRPAVFVPESKRLNVLLRQFQQDRNHMALVIDEYGTLAGLLTIEDVLEEIVGEIEDEYDIDEDQAIRKISNTRYVVNALASIEDFNESFGSKLPKDEFDTIGGIIVNQFGHLPKRNEEIILGNITFRVMQADSRRLRTLRITINSDNQS